MVFLNILKNSHKKIFIKILVFLYLYNWCYSNFKSL